MCGQTEQLVKRPATEQIGKPPKRLCAVPRPLALGASILPLTSSRCCQPASLRHLSGRGHAIDCKCAAHSRRIRARSDGERFGTARTDARAAFINQVFSGGSERASPASSNQSLADAQRAGIFERPSPSRAKAIRAPLQQDYFRFEKRIRLTTYIR